MTGGALTAGMNYAAYTTNLAVADVKKGVDGVKDTITFQDGITHNLISSTALNAMTNVTDNSKYVAATLDKSVKDAADATQQRISDVGADTQDKIQQTSDAVQQKMTALEAQVVVDMKGMLSQLLTALFVPDAATFNQFLGLKDQFLNWGPYSLINSFILVTQTPAGDGSVNGLPGLSFPEIALNASDYTQIVLGTSGGGLPNVAMNADGTSGSATASVVPPNTFYATGRNIPIPMGIVVNNPIWPWIYKFMIGMMWSYWLANVGGLLFPRQQF